MHRSIVIVAAAAGLLLTGCSTQPMPMLTTTSGPETPSPAPAATAGSGEPGATTPAAAEPCPESSGSAEVPCPSGTIARAGDWDVVVGAAELDADALVVADDYNEPPHEGHRFIRVPVEATHRGPEEARSIWVEVAFVAPDGTQYRQIDTGTIVEDGNPDCRADLDESCAWFQYIAVPIETLEQGTLLAYAGSPEAGVHFSLQ